MTMLQLVMRRRRGAALQRETLVLPRRLRSAAARPARTRQRMLVAALPSGAVEDQRGPARRAEARPRSRRHLVVDVAVAAQRRKTREPNLGKMPRASKHL